MTLLKWSSYLKDKSGGIFVILYKSHEKTACWSVSQCFLSSWVCLWLSAQVSQSRVTIFNCGEYLKQQNRVCEVDSEKSYSVCLFMVMREQRCGSLVCFLIVCVQTMKLCNTEEEEMSGWYTNRSKRSSSLFVCLGVFQVSLAMGWWWKDNKISQNKHFRKTSFSENIFFYQICFLRCCVLTLRATILNTPQWQLLVCGTII